MNSGIIISEVRTKKDLKTFIYLPEKIRKNDAFWVPPLYMDEWEYHNPHKNKAFSYSDVERFIAWKDGEPAGRIMTIINHTYNQQKNEKTGRFCWLESIEDFEVVEKLICKAESWCREKGMDKMIGPFGFSDKDPEGLLLEGHGDYPVLVTNYSPPYLVTYMEKLGFTKETDMLEYRIEIPEHEPELYSKLSQRTNHSPFKLIEPQSKKEVKKYLRAVFQLMNEAYADIFGYMPVDDQEADEFGKRYLPILDVEFIKLILNSDNELAAFIVGIPDISKGLIKAKGRLLPLGFYHIFKSRNTSDKLVLLLGAIKPRYQGLGLDVMMGKAMIKSAMKRKMKLIDSHLILEDNLKMRAEVEKLGGKVYRRYRVFQKSLNSHNV